MKWIISAIAFVVIVTGCGPDEPTGIAEVEDDDRVTALVAELGKGEAADTEYAERLLRNLYADYGVIEPPGGPFDSRGLSTSAYPENWPYCTWADLMYEAGMCYLAGAEFTIKLTKGSPLATPSYVLATAYCTLYSVEKHCYYTSGIGGGGSW